MTDGSSSPTKTPAIGTVTPADTAKHLQRRAEQQRRQGAVRARELRRRLPEAATILRERYAANEMILFASLATGACREDGDVDLAVFGLPKALYFSALADLMGLFGAPVDLVRLEEAPESLRDRILDEGERL